MVIETKYEVYDKIHFLSNNKACFSIVRGIKTHTTSCPQEIDTEITYLCNDDDDAKVFIKVLESDAFKSKEELLKSL